jgi:hypothetical protein
MLYYKQCILWEKKNKGKNKSGCEKKSGGGRYFVEEETVEYQNSWEWLQSNWKQPLPSLAYVVAVSCAVSTKNTLCTRKHDVLVEVHQGDLVTAGASIYLPRLCIMARASWMDHIKPEKQSHPFLAIAEA